MKLTRADLLAELQAAEESGELSEFGRDCLREELGPDCAAVIVRMIERPRDATARDARIYNAYRAMRKQKIKKEDARLLLHADFPTSAVNQIVDHSLRRRTCAKLRARKKRKSRRKITATLAGVSGSAPE